MARGASRAGGTQTQAQPFVEGSGSLPDQHRFAFLQAIMYKKWMSEADARALFTELANLAGQEASYLDTIAALNEGLDFLLMEIRQLKSPVDRSRYIGFVNKENDETAKKHGSTYSIQQIHYLRSVITAIALDEDAEDGVGSLDGITCGHLRANEDLLSQTQAPQSQAIQSKQLTLTQKSDALDLYVRDGWLSHTPGKSGYYSLGVRTFLELHDMLLNLPLPDETRRQWEAFL